MDSLSKSLLDLCAEITRFHAAPAVDHVYLPPSNPDFAKSRKFGLVVLDDRSTGFFYTLFGRNGDGHGTRGDAARGYPADALELAHWYEDSDVQRRGIGLGAIGALTQSFFRRAGFEPPAARNPMADFDFDDSDHVGMVGYFPALVDKLRERRIHLTVLELEDRFLTSGPRFEVTLQPARLAACNKVLCTASTLVNDTVDEVLAAASGAQRVAVIGPSAGCAPDPLFARGVKVVGGARVNDHARLEAHCDAQTDWGDSVSKYCLKPATYPGARRLLESLARTR